MGLGMFLPTIDQRDRIQNMSQFMNSDGSSLEFMTLLMLVAGFLVLVLILKRVGEKQQSKNDKKSQKK